MCSSDLQAPKTTITPAKTQATESEGGVYVSRTSKPPRPLSELVPNGKIPSVRKGEFNQWYNEMTPEEFKSVWEVPEYRDAIEARIRQPGGLHEWLPVSRTDTFKEWGVSMEEIKSMRTSTKDIEGASPAWTHGGEGSGTAHNEIFEIERNSRSFAEYKENLQNWADTRLKGGRSSLPEGLRD